MVYRADDLRLGREVAVKIMHPHLADDEKFTRRFEQEARSAAGLSHPNIVNVFDQGEAGGVPYLVMEYLPGITLRDLLKQRRALSSEEAAEIAEAVLAGIAAAHESGIVHRDVKPENVLLADDGRIKIGDFGLARAVSANTTTGQALLGTIAYLSPELVTRGIADERSDLYAFGIMLFEMLTGTQPYTGEQAMQIAYQHAHSDVPAPSTLAPEVPEAFDRLVLWCTRRAADARPNDGREALNYLVALRTEGVSAATAVLPTTSSFHSVTPSTAVLSQSGQQLLAASTAAQHTTAHDTASRSAEHESAASRARARARRRFRRGGWLAALFVLLLGITAGLGWWWGQGPGSLVPVPDVTGQSIDEAQTHLAAETFVVEVVDCPSLDVPPGLASGTTPQAGARVPRGSTVELCRSTGPELLPVPDFVGMTLEAATAAIAEAGFVFGEVSEERFDGGIRGTVILAVDSDGAALGEHYPEQGVISLVLSAGSVPAVEGLTLEHAISTLGEAGLTVEPANNSEAHHAEIEAGRVIRLLSDAEVLRIGDAVGLEISLGPELFPVPDVAAEGMSVNEAAAYLREQGFEVDAGLIEIGSGAGDLIGVKRTVPAAGEMVPKGTVISFRYI